MNQTKILFISFLFAPCWALAYPAVGDKVSWVGDVVQADGSTVSVKLVKEVIAHDTVTGKWTVKKDVTVDKESTSETILEETMYSPEQYKNILDTCSDKAGVVEDVTVPAGTFKACKLTTIKTDGSVIDKWWGDVPFGLVRKNHTAVSDAKDTRLDLVSIVNGF